MKICAVSPFTRASANEILSFIQHANGDLIVLPGRSENTPSAQDMQGAARPRVTVFAEEEIGGERIPCILTRDQSVSMPGQIFSRSPTAKQMDDLVKAWPNRTFPIGWRTVTFVICGEINGFHPNGGPKHNRALPFDVLVNPTHTVMGRWQHLGRKLVALSKGRVVVHAANNDRNHENLTTDLRVYMDGELLKAKVQGNLKWCECEI